MEAPRLQNPFVSLVPLTTDHAEPLSGLIDTQLWAGMTTPVPDHSAAMVAYIEGLSTKPDRMDFAVLTPKGVVAGATSFYDVVLNQGRLEIGSTFYGRQHWGTKINPAAKHLLLGYAFDVLDAYRVAFRCDVRNMRSQSAIERLGATREGVLRGHRKASDGSRSDTQYSSILRPEWPKVDEDLRARLA